MTKQYTPNFIEFLKNRLLKPLPGNSAHKKIYLDCHKIEINTIHTDSAVVLLLFPENQFYSTILIKRSIFNGLFSGDMALPGGKYNEQDEILEKTALRELGEEVGIKSDNLQIIGKLTEIYIQRKNILVSTFIAYIPEKPHIEVNYEVDSYYEVDILEFLSNKIKTTNKVFKDGNNEIINYFEVENNLIWGITGMIMSEFSMIMEEYLEK